MMQKTLDSPRSIQQFHKQTQPQNNPKDIKISIIGIEMSSLNSRDDEHSTEHQ